MIHHSNIHSSPPPPSIPSPTTSSSPPPSIPSPDSPTNSNHIPPDTLVPLRRSTRSKQPPAWHNDYEISSDSNHLTSTSSPNTNIRYPLHHYLSFSRFSPTQCVFLALIKPKQNLKPMMRQLATLYGSRL